MIRILSLPILLTIGISLLSSCAHQPGAQGGWEWQSDKIQHFTISSLMAGTVARHQMSNDERDCQAALVGITFSMSIGAGKEAYDKYIKKTYWDWADLGWDLAGSTLGGVVGGKCY